MKTDKEKRDAWRNRDQIKLPVHQTAHGFTVDDYLGRPRNHPDTNRLLELFLKEHYVVVTHQGLEEMTDIFESVPLDDRGGVFSGFLIELQSRGFNYLPEQFQNDVQELSEVSIG